VDKPIRDRWPTQSNINVRGVGVPFRGERIPYNTVKLYLNIEHTAIGDLVIKVHPPVGAPIVISDLAGGDTDNLVIDGVPFTTDRSGRPNGQWTLSIRDTKRGDVGRLVSWALEFPSPSAQ
jgi:subtilisin-like proprotein convertase family protein